MAKMRCTNNRIIFQFLETLSSGSFDNVTTWGFEIKNAREDLKTHRWGKVIEIGKKVQSVKPGDYILIENLMWSNNFLHEKEKYWVTDESKVIGVSDTRPKD